MVVRAGVIKCMQRRKGYGTIIRNKTEKGYRAVPFLFKVYTCGVNGMYNKCQQRNKKGTTIQEEKKERESKRNQPFPEGGKDKSESENVTACIKRGYRV